MKKSNTSRLRGLKLLVFLTLPYFWYSCDTDPINLGSEFINVNPTGTIVESTYDVKTINIGTGPVRSDNFSSVVLGRYQDGVFSNKEYSFVSQAGLGFYNPTFTPIPEDPPRPPNVLRVQIYIPYFSREVGVNGNETLYELDSIYSGRDFSYNLKLSRSNYFLNSFDPNDISRPAEYFSDQKSLISNSVSSSDLIHEFSNEDMSSEEVIVNNLSEEEINRLPPGLYVSQELNEGDQNLINFFQNLLLDPANADQLVSVSTFRNYFRGVFFEADNFSGGNSLVHLNINNAFIEVTIEDPNIASGSSVRLTFNGVRANFIETDIPPSVQQEIAASTEADGSERILLNGGPGSFSIIDIFGDDNDGSGFPDALEELKNDQVLINDAFIDFYVDQDAQIIGRQLPERITLFDPRTTSPISDYSLSDIQLVDQINANSIHLGRLERETQGDLESPGVKYRIRIADYLARLIDIDFEDLSGDELRLAIAVSQNIGSITPNALVGPTQPVDVDNIQLGTAISHEGVVLHGNMSPRVELRPKLTVFYTPIN